MKIVFALLVCLPGTAYSAEEPIATRTQVAIGLAPLDRGMSLWLVRPKTWVGVELERFELTWEERLRRDPDHNGMYYGPPIDRLTRWIHAAVTVQRQIAQGPVFRFVYLRLYGKYQVDP